MTKLEEFEKELDAMDQGYIYKAKLAGYAGRRANVLALHRAALEDAERLTWVIDQCEQPPWQPFWYSGTDDYRVKARTAIDAARSKS